MNGRRAALAAGLALILLPVAGRAGPGHDHGEAEVAATSTTVDAPSRLPDGTVFLPKVSQRLLEVRTAILRETEASRTVTLVGRVVADPNRGGLAQSIAGGRIVPPEGGLPRLGQAVRRGQKEDPPIYAGDIIVIDGSKIKALQKQILSSLPVLSIFGPL